jgi:hypothetical protein
MPGISMALPGAGRGYCCDSCIVNHPDAIQGMQSRFVSNLPIIKRFANFPVYVRSMGLRQLQLLYGTG